MKENNRLMPIYDLLQPKLEGAAMMMRKKKTVP